jgi:tetratricopeptide (TPR) repeat protein
LANLRAKRRALLPWVFACATVGLLAAEDAAAQNNTSSGWWPFGQSSSAASGQDKQLDDSISLKTQGKAGVELYVALANFYVVSGKFPEAEAQYQEAMKKAPSDIRVLLGYAKLKDQMNRPQEAQKLYQTALEKHPKQPSVHNDLAVHYVRYGMLREAIESGQHAVELSPREPRYRNNLAAILVEAGYPQEAFKQLRAVYDEPIAHYDLGFLLNKRGIKAAALQEFTIALQLNPGMTLARQWVERLSRERAEGSHTIVGTLPPQGQVPAAVATNPSYGRDEPPPPPTAPLPPQYGAPPQYANPPQPPAQVQYPDQVQYPVPPRNQPQYVAPQNARPQYSGPQYQNPGPPAGNPAPVVAGPDPQAPGGRGNPPPADDSGTLRRLPPVDDPNRDAQGPEGVAPNPPDWRR